jgi:hypothetical protein
MSTYSSIAWLPLCAGLTVLGLVLTYIVARRRGWRAMLRGSAWSLLPIAAYLTGSIEMFWKIGTAIGNFATAFAFSSEKWAGIGVAGLAVALFMASGGRVRRKAARGRATVPGRAAARAAERSRKRDAADRATVPDEVAAPDGLAPAATDGSSPTTALSPLPVRRPEATKTEPVKREPGRKQAAKPAADDDLKEVEEILRRRGL